MLRFFHAIFYGSNCSVSRALACGVIAACIVLMTWWREEHAKSFQNGLAHAGLGALGGILVSLVLSIGDRMPPGIPRKVVTALLLVAAALIVCLVINSVTNSGRR